MTSKRVPIALAFALGGLACGETIQEQTPASLVETIKATDTECPGGAGNTIRIGFDANADGVLQEAEVASTESVCDGATGGPGEPGEDGLRSLLVQATEAPGANCTFGGERIDAGFDDNGDGQLDADEIDATTYVCNGAPGVDARQILTRTSTDTGDQCSELGGQRVQSGLDDNGDGVLSADEVDVDQFLCGGENSQRNLVVIDEEPPGSRCSAGGQRIRTGLDRNNDGLLQEIEVDDEEIFCSPLRTLTEISNLTAGTTTVCVAGGQRIDVGVDDDGNGVLSAAEVDLTTFACSGSDGDALIARRTPIAPGAECAFGGERLAWGRDANGNGTLESTEEDSVSFVCDGADGATGTSGSAVRLTPELAGANCARGGTRIETGPDLDGDGQLSDTEVRATRFTCNGPALTSLVEITPEAAGLNCASGGQRIDTGVDTNLNGVLEPNEINSTSFVCSTRAVVPIGFVTATLTDALQNNAYTATIEAVGGVGGGYTWTATGLPAGFALGASGTPSTTLSGIPGAPGTFNFQVTVTDFFGTSATQTFSLVVTGAPLQIDTFVLPRLESGVAYNFQLSASEGATAITPASWSVVGGTLPPGLGLSTTGLITGTPTTARGSAFIVEASDGTTTVRAGLRIKGEQNFAAYCGDYVVDAQEDISVVEVLGGTITSTGTVVDNATIEADCFEQIEFANNVVVFMGNETSGRDEIFAVDLANFPSVGSPRRLNPTSVTSASHDADVTEFKISPTNRYVAFRADDVVNFDEELFVYDLANLATGTADRVNLATVDVISPTDYQWVPGTNKLVYISEEPGSLISSLFLYDADLGGSPVQLNGALATNGDVFTFTISPDGRYVAYVADETVDAENQAYLVDISGPAPSNLGNISGLATGGDVATGTFGDLEFSPNGDWLLFIARPGTSGGDEVYVKNVRQSLAEPARRLSQDLSSGGTLLDVFEAAWSPDGRRVAYYGDAETSGKNELWVADTLVPGSPVKFSPTSAPADWDVNAINCSSCDEFAWDPNGRFLVYDINITGVPVAVPYLTFLDTPSSSIEIFPVLADDIFSVKISDDSSNLFYSAEVNGSSIVELYLVPVGANTLGTPLPVNSPSPLGSLQDIDDEFSLIGDGAGVLYWSDEVTSNEDEAFFRTISGSTVGSRFSVNPSLPTNGDIDKVAVQEE